jgi:uncharacterized membrane protein SirB2
MKYIYWLVFTLLCVGGLKLMATNDIRPVSMAGHMVYLRFAVLALWLIFTWLTFRKPGLKSIEERLNG